MSVIAFLFKGTQRLHFVKLKLRIKYHLGSRTPQDAAGSLFCYRDLGIKQYF